MEKTDSGARHPHGHFVGNGGQAIEVEGALYPRDLYERGNYTFAHIGVNASPEIADRVLHLPMPEAMPFNRALLANKLTEINEAFPNLGDHLFRALRRYEWVVVEGALPQTDEYDDGSAEPRRADWVQIANRVRDAIFVSRPNWLRLGEIGRISILVHEAVYSLVAPTPARGGTRRQVGSVARRIAGAFFDPTVFRTAPARESLRADLDRLAVPAIPVVVDPPVPQTAYWILQRVARAAEPATEPDTIELPVYRIRSYPEFYARALRTNLAHWLEKPDTSGLRSVLDGERFESRFRAYPTTNGFEQFALEVRAAGAPTSSESRLDGTSAADLADFLAAHFRDIAARS